MSATLSSPARRKNPLREAYEIFGVSFQPTHLATLTYSLVIPGVNVVRSIPMSQVHRDLHQLRQDVDLAVLGTDFNEPDNRAYRTSFIAFVEPTSSSVRVQALYRVPLRFGLEFSEFELHLPRRWSVLVGAPASAEVREIYDLEEAAQCALKHKNRMGNRLIRDDLVVFSRDLDGG